MQLKKFVSFISQGFLNAASQLLQSTSFLFISLIIVPSYGVKFWGEFVAAVLLPGLIVHMVSWGNTSYLLRIFSFESSRIGKAWQENFMARLVLYLVLCLGLLLIPVAGFVKFSVFLWMTGSFLYQPFLVLIIFHKKFFFSFLLEVLAIVPLLIYLYFQEVSSVHELMVIAAIPFYFKVLMAAHYFRKIVFKDVKVSLNLQLFRDAFPHFILSIVGILASRVGLYIAALLLQSDELGTYQIINSFFSVAQVMAFFFIQPLMKNLYRIKIEKLRALAKKMFLFGVLLLLVATFFIGFIVRLYFQIDCSPTLFVVGYMMALPYYYYAVYINRTTTGNQERLVRISISSIIINATLSVPLIIMFNSLGALLANAITQWALLFFFYFKDRRPLHQESKV